MANKQVAGQRADVATSAADPVVYPHADGQPMAEGRLHLAAIVSILQPLEWRYRDRADISVDGDMFVYYVPGDNKTREAPDAMVWFGVRDRPRRSYRAWEVGTAPAFVAEVSSTTSGKDDQTAKLAAYELMGVQEYLLFDPLYEDEGEDGRLQLYKRRGPRLVPSGPGEGAGSTEVLHSDVLGVTLRAEGKLVRLKDALTGEILTRYEENQELLRLAQEGRRAAERERDAMARRRRAAERERDAMARRRRAAERERDAEVEIVRAQQARIARLEAAIRAIG